MTDFHEKEGSLWVEDVPVSKIIQETGTPTYIYSAEHIRTQFQTLRNAISGVLSDGREPLLCYACKANSNQAILTFLKVSGSGLEIVSEGELFRGLAAGFDPKEIVSTGIGKTDSEIASCLKAGILQINVESLPELQNIQRIAQNLDLTVDIVFRFNPDVSGGGHDKISTGRKHDKFGLSVDQVHQGFSMARKMSHVSAVGLSMHIGSQVFTVGSFEQAFQTLPKLVKDLRADGYSVARLDIGGGFPIRYKDEELLDLSAYAAWVRDIIAPLDTDIIMEPGRYLTGNAGILVTQIQYVKENEDRTFMILDAGMNDLARPAMYDAYHAIEAVENRNRPLKTYDVVGPVCESSCRFATEYELSSSDAGDLIAIRSAGAYGFSMASNYNTRKLPTEVLVDGDRYVVISPRQSFQDIIDRDVVPDWLQGS